MTDLYHEAGPGAPPTVLFLHEGAGSSAAWHRVKQRLVPARRTVLYDRRGYGRSPRDVALDDHHFDQAVEDLAELVRELDTAPVDLVGHSDGGSVALLFAARHPGMVRTVTVVATHVFADAGTTSAVRGLGSPASWDERTQLRYAAVHGSDWEEVVNSWLQLWTQGGLSTWDMRPELGRVTAPLLVVHDRADPLSPVIHADQLGQLVPDCRMCWYDTGSHRPHLAAPERFAVDVRTFWQEVSSG